jgi:hypothetical protein
LDHHCGDHDLPLAHLPETVAEYFGAPDDRPLDGCEVEMPGRLEHLTNELSPVVLQVLSNLVSNHRFFASSRIPAITELSSLKTQRRVLSRTQR